MVLNILIEDNRELKLLEFGIGLLERHRGTATGNSSDITSCHLNINFIKAERAVLGNI